MLLPKRIEYMLGIAVMVFAFIFWVLIPFQTVDTPILGARGFDLITGAFFPRIAAIALFASGLFLTVLTFLRKDFSNQEYKELFNKKQALQLFYVIIGGFIYIGLVNLIGYRISTILLFISMMCTTRCNNWKVVLIYSVVATLVIYYVFGSVFYIPLQ